ncbi:MAG: hypothetical protein ACYDBB_11505 [Armatimonadota bacterium]
MFVVVPSCARICFLVTLVLLCTPLLHAEPILWSTGLGTSEVENRTLLENDLTYAPGNGQTGPKAGPKAAVFTWDTIPAGQMGRYRATLRARTEKLGLSSAMLQASVEKDTMNLIAGMPMGGRAFSAAGQWQDFTLEFDVEAGKAVTVGLLYIGDKTAPPAGKIQVDKASIKLEKIDVPVTVSWARSAKLRYKHHEKGALDIRLTNATNQPQTVSVQAVINSDAEVKTTGVPQAFTVPAMSTTTGSVPFAVPAGDGGYALAAEVLQGDKVIDQRSGDIFCVADSPFQCAIQPIGGMPFCGPGAYHLELKGFKSEVLGKWDDYLKLANNAVEGMRRNYITYYEYFAWAREDATLLVEDTDEPYLGGQASYPASRKQFRLLNALLHNQGIAPVAYVNATPFGWPGFEVMRKRPEWFTGSSSSFDTEALEKYRKGIQPGYIYPWIGATWDKPSPVDGKTYLQYHIEQLTGSAKMYGWEAFRYDAGPLSLQHFPIVKQALAKQNPPVYIGNNQGLCCLGTQQSDGWKTYCKDGSFMMEELINAAFTTPTDPRRKWTDWIDYLRLGSHLTRMNGGHYTWINHSGNYYSCALGYSVGGHPWSIQKNPYGDAERFMVRYGYYFWDLRTHMLPQPETTLTVNSGRPLWWKQLASERKLETNHRQVIVPLINPPAEETVNGTTMVGAAADTIVTFKPQAGEKVTAFLLTSEPIAHREELVAKTLPDGRVEVSVPYFWVWTNVVFDCSVR